MDSMEANTKMDSMEAKLDTNIDGLKGEIMEVLKHFVTEKTPESEMHPMKFMMRTQGRLIKNGETPTLV
jgi:hypothetical protein